MELSNGALIHYPTSVEGPADLELSLTRQQLGALLVAGRTDGITMAGDVSALGQLIALTDSPDPDFAVVTP